MTENPPCNICNTKPDNLIHIIVTCRKTQEFWIKLIEFANSIFTNITTLNTIDINIGTFLSDKFYKKVYEYEYFEKYCSSER